MRPSLPAALALAILLAAPAAAEAQAGWTRVAPPTLSTGRTVSGDGATHLAYRIGANLVLLGAEGSKRYPIDGTNCDLGPMVGGRTLVRCSRHLVPSQTLVGPEGDKKIPYLGMYGARVVAIGDRWAFRVAMPAYFREGIADFYDWRTGKSIPTPFDVDDVQGADLDSAVPKPATACVPGFTLDREGSVRLMRTPRAGGAGRVVLVDCAARPLKPRTLAKVRDAAAVTSGQLSKGFATWADGRTASIVRRSTGKRRTWRFTSTRRLIGDAPVTVAHDAKRLIAGLRFTDGTTEIRTARIPR